MEPAPPGIWLRDPSFIESVAPFRPNFHHPSGRLLASAETLVYEEARQVSMSARGHVFRRQLDRHPLRPFPDQDVEHVESVPLQDHDVAASDIDLGFLSAP